MNIVFRVDASLQMGTGHLMRCLTLANCLQAQGHHCLFICREHPGAQPELIQGAGHRVELLPQGCYEPYLGEPSHASWLGATWEHDAEQVLALLQGQDLHWLVVDHYSLDQHWERKVRACAQHLMVIDDLADRVHCCDLLLDQNLGRQARDYDALRPCKADLLIGPHYALLRPEFAERREASLVRRTHLRGIRKILVTMGGVDIDNVTEQVLGALDLSSDANLEITVVMGSKAPWLASVQQYAASMVSQVRVLRGVGNMAELMNDNDICIGAAGSTSWERCCLGMPAILICLADNQRGVIAALEQEGAIRSFDAAKLRECPQSLLSLMRECQRDVLELVARAAQVTDGLGAQRVTKKMESFYG